MRIKTFVAAGLLTVAAVAGVSTAATATATPQYQAAYTGYYAGSYATYAACAADGSSPSTGGSYWECEQTYDGWDLYIYY
ncbi:hypothetical protein DFR70_106402 [Nocardia tenerifensis]|uniref:Secreted protein n=1 Tax=Nocardia tenerifensis TaxID=228006 RepID=A0A318K0L0_9NOCA|nr:hypothetical protein [Nocardia tenerifensis]PXX63338.1 hypothetical protein DFR70_106402 [Nocardia tenerifensis]